MNSIPSVFAASLIRRKAWLFPVVVIEGGGGACVVETEQLVYTAGHLRRIVVFVAGEDAVPHDPATVGLTYGVELK